MMKNRLLALVLTAGLALHGGVACHNDPQRQGVATTYYCPMHPTYIADAPGDCPICGMRLVPTKPTSTPAPSTAATADMVPGFASVRGDAARLRRAGVRTVAARRGTLARSLRTVATVVADETLIQHVHTRTAGWVEHLHQRFAGQMVKKGEPIVTFYSPELVASQEEYLSIHATARKLQSSELAGVRASGESMLASARGRLRQFEVSERLIGELEARGTARRTVTLLAPVSGVVTVKTTFAGQQVEPGQELFAITDLGRVWIEADAYELDATSLHLGQLATLTLPFDPSFKIRVPLTYIDPLVRPDTRTIRLRFAAPNPELRLRLNQFVDVALELEAAEGVLVPDDAILASGLRHIVFVERGQGELEPREVEVVTREGGMALLSSGVEAGERVVVSAAFLVDSESRLRAAIGAVAPRPPATGGVTP